MAKWRTKIIMINNLNKFTKAFIIFDCIFYECIGVYCISQGDVGYIPFFMIGMLFVTVKIYRGYILEKNETSKYICIEIAALLLNLLCLYLCTHDVSETLGLILTIAMISILPILMFVIKYVIHDKN
jgi:hypothetical protein